MLKSTFRIIKGLGGGCKSRNLGIMYGGIVYFVKFVRENYTAVMQVSNIMGYCYTLHKLISKVMQHI